MKIFYVPFFAQAGHRHLPQCLSEEIIKLLDLANQQGTTVLVVTHNLDVVQQMRQRTITMSEGKIISDMAKGGFSYED